MVAAHEQIRVEVRDRAVADRVRHPLEERERQSRGKQQQQKYNAKKSEQQRKGEWANLFIKKIHFNWREHFHDLGCSDKRY